MTSRFSGKMNHWYGIVALMAFVLGGGQMVAAEPCEDSAVSEDFRLCEESCLNKLQCEADMMEAMRLKAKPVNPPLALPEPVPLSFPVPPGLKGPGPGILGPDNMGREWWPHLGPSGFAATEAELTPEELAEIEWIKSQIGDGRSVAAPLEWLEQADTLADEWLEQADTCTDEGPMPVIFGGERCFPSATPLSRGKSSESQMLRKMARELEQSAADLEERGEYLLADQMRELAASHWRIARQAGATHVVISAEQSE